MGGGGTRPSNVHMFSADDSYNPAKMHGSHARNTYLCFNQPIKIIKARAQQFEQLSSLGSVILEKKNFEKMHDCRSIGPSTRLVEKKISEHVQFRCVLDSFRVAEERIERRQLHLRQ
jgi:hypothetical protein